MSQDELVDIVSETDEPTGLVVTKREAHEKGLLHRTTISEVIRSDGRWLMVKQAGDRQDPGQYVSPVGGHVQAGESEIDAVKREAREEIGLEGDYRCEFVGRAVYNRRVLDRQENHFFIMYKMYSDAEPVLNAESESCRYFTEDELKSELKEHPEMFGVAFRFVAERFFPQLLID